MKSSGGGSDGDRANILRLPGTIEKTGWYTTSYAVSAWANLDRALSPTDAEEPWT